MNWIASDTTNWIFFGLGILSAALALVEKYTLTPLTGSPLRDGRMRMFFSLLLVWSPAVVGPLLLIGGAVLVSIDAGRLSWLGVFSGAVCLLVFAFLRLRRAPIEQDDLVSRVRSEVDYLLGVRRSSEYALLPGPSDIAEEVYLNLVKNGVLPPRKAGDFDNFANSMVHAGIWVPVSIYTSADDGTGLKDAVVAVLREFGLTSAVEEPPVQGSWFQRLWSRGKDLAGSEPVRERLAKLERALELEHLGKRQAAVDGVNSESVAALYGAVKEQENAIVRTGSIIMIKTGSNLVVWTIGAMEAAELEKHSELLRDPWLALEYLSSLRRSQPERRADADERAISAPGRTPEPPLFEITTGAQLAQALRNRVDLSRMIMSVKDLRGADLSDANLNGVRLLAVDLSDATLYQARLCGAQLSDANLSGAYLGVADLTRADLNRANLTGAYLVHARLYGARLREANLRGADLGGAKLSDADLSGALLDNDALQQGRLDFVQWSNRTTWPVHLAGEIRKRSRDRGLGEFVVEESTHSR